MIAQNYGSSLDVDAKRQHIFWIERWQLLPEPRQRCSNKAWHSQELSCAMRRVKGRSTFWRKHMSQWSKHSELIANLPCCEDRLKIPWELAREVDIFAFSIWAIMSSYAAVLLYRNHSSPWKESWIRQDHKRIASRTIRYIRIERWLCIYTPLHGKNLSPLLRWVSESSTSIESGLWQSSLSDCSSGNEHLWEAIFQREGKNG